MILVLTIGISFLIPFLLIPKMIPVLQKLNAGQTIREEGPESHFAKTGTPTMGGLSIVLGVSIGVLIWSVWAIVEGVPNLTHNLISIGCIWLLFVGHGLLGFLDDYIKIKKKRNLGLTAKGKLIGQIFLSLVLVGLSSYLGRGTDIYLFATAFSFDLGVIGFTLFTLIVVIGTSNAVNLTDGLDGLAGGVTVFSATALGILGAYLGAEGESIFAFAIAGGCLGFLKYNRNPALIFMGDTGSLALGGGLAAIAVLLKQEMLLVVIGGVYVIEAVSVIIQVVYFKMTKGKRFFRMTPIHHHFELGGWSEKKVVAMFWLLAFLLGCLGVFIGIC